MRNVRIFVNLAISSHVPGATADTADNVRSKIALLRAIIFTVPEATTVLADLIFVVAQCSVERSQFAELVPLVVVLSFGRRCRLGEYENGQGNTE